MTTVKEEILAANRTLTRYLENSKKFEHVVQIKAKEEASIKTEKNQASANVAQVPALLQLSICCIDLLFLKEKKEAQATIIKINKFKASEKELLQAKQNHANAMKEKKIKIRKSARLANDLTNMARQAKGQADSASLSSELSVKTVKRVRQKLRKHRDQGSADF